MLKRCRRAPNRVPNCPRCSGKVAFSRFSSLFLAFARLRQGESYPLGGAYYIPPTSHSLLFCGAYTQNNAIYRKRYAFLIVRLCQLLALVGLASQKQHSVVFDSLAFNYAGFFGFNWLLFGRTKGEETVFSVFSLNDCSNALYRCLYSLTQ